jgi:hypothetical protein
MRVVKYSFMDTGAPMPAPMAEIGGATSQKWSPRVDARENLATANDQA